MGYRPVKRKADEDKEDKKEESEEDFFEDKGWKKTQE